MNHRLLILPLLLVLAAASLGAVDVTTQHNDISRTGANLAETVLTPANVNQAGFGKLFECAVDDEVYAQPLYLSALDNIAGGTHNVVYVTSVNNSVYAFDADTGTVLWSRLAVDTDGTHIVPLFSNMTGACGGNYKDFDSHMGIVGAGVIDRANGRFYFLSRTRTNDANPDNAIYLQYLHVVNIRTGADLPGSPYVLTGHTAGNPATGIGLVGSGDGTDGGNVWFDPRRNNQRVSILLHPNGNVYLGWSSHCDWGPYHGWFMGFNYNGAAFSPVCKMVTTPNSQNGGIWMSNNGCAADGLGIYFSTGNGTYSDGLNFADSLVRVNPTTAAVLDWFTPYNEVALNAADADFGVSGPMIIPGTYGGRSLLLTTSKEGKFYVIDRTNLGHKTISTTADDQIVQAFQPFVGHIHGSAVFFDAGSAKYAYAWSENDRLKSFTLQTNGTFVTTPAAQSVVVAPGGMPGGFLSVSANGTSNGIVWASLPWSGNANQQTQPGVLRAFDAVTLNELWNSHQFPLRDDFGNFAKDSNPTIANGKVYMATFSNKLCVYGTLPQNNSLAVLITSPATGTVLAEPASLTINAATTIGSGTITKVEFFVNNVKIGEDATAPYSLAWNNVYDGTYALTAMVTDSNGAKAMSATVTVTVSGGAGSGSILREYWTGISNGVSIANLLTDTANFANAPSGRSQPTIFEAPVNFADNYGMRMRGYVYPPVSGTYTFWIASDDNGELWLSTDANPANITATNGGNPICRVPNWTDNEAWDVDPAQRSAAIALVGGTQYYIEAREKEGGGGDNLAVGWQLPGGSYERPITGGHLSPFILATTPVVTSVTANTGPTTGGTGVAIAGSGFTGATAVLFGGVAATGLTVNSATSITCTTPAHAAGAVNVDVVVAGLMGTKVGGFTYVVPAGTPTITAVNPVFGPAGGGTVVTITGTNLTGTTAVSFGGVAATNISSTATTVTCTTAPHAAGAVDVVVTNGTGTVTLGNGFCYIPGPAAPTIASISPPTGSTLGGTVVTISGSNLSGVTGVTFGGGAATNIVVAGGGTSLTCHTPAHAAGQVDVVVTNGGGAATSTNGYTFVAMPTVTSISPPTGGSGTTIIITGTNLNGTTSVTIGGVALTYTVNSANQITATIPAGAVSGSVVVTTPAGSAASAAVFNAPPPSSSSSKCGGGLTALIGLLVLTMLRRVRLVRDPE